MKRLLAVFTSGRTLAALVLGWVLFYVSWAVWGTEAFASYIGLLSRSAIVQGIYVLFVLSVAGFGIRQGIARYRENKARFALWAVLPAGIIVFLIGFLLSVSLRQSDTLAVAEGETVTPPWSSSSFMVEHLRHGLDENVTDSGSGIFAYAPEFTALKPDGSRAEVTAFPPTRIGSTYYHILIVNLAPSLIVSGPGGEVLQQGLLPLKLLPPGATDDFDIEGRHCPSSSRRSRRPGRPRRGWWREWAVGRRPSHGAGQRAPRALIRLTERAISRRAPCLP